MQPKPRGEEWMKRPAFLLKRGHPTEGHVMLIGDSVVKNFFRFHANCMMSIIVALTQIKLQVGLCKLCKCFIKKRKWYYHYFDWYFSWSGKAS